MKSTLVSRNNTLRKYPHIKGHTNFNITNDGDSDSGPLIDALLECCKDQAHILDPCGAPKNKFVLARILRLTLEAGLAGEAALYLLDVGEVRALHLDLLRDALQHRRDLLALVAAALQRALALKPS